MYNLQIFHTLVQVYTYVSAYVDVCVCVFKNEPGPKNPTPPSMVWCPTPAPQTSHLHIWSSWEAQPLSCTLLTVQHLERTASHFYVICSI